MGLFDKMKNKASEVVSEQSKNLKSVEIGGKKIGEVVKPLENMASNMKSNYDAGKKERVIKLQVSKLIGPPSSVVIRRDTNDLFYFSKGFNEIEPRFLFQSYEWAGPDIDKKAITKTKGKTKTKGRMGQALVGGALLGTKGAIIGAAGARKSDVDLTSVTENIENEKDTKAKLIFKSVDDNEIKEIAIANNSKTNAEIMSFFQNIEPVLTSTSTVVETQQVISDDKSPVEQVKELKELLDMDIITQEEFDLKKKELLNL